MTEDDESYLERLRAALFRAPTIEELTQEGLNNILSMRASIAGARAKFAPWKDSEAFELWARTAEFWLDSLEANVTSVTEDGRKHTTVDEITPSTLLALAEFAEGMKRWIYGWEELANDLPKRIDDDEDPDKA